MKTKTNPVKIEAEGFEILGRLSDLEIVEAEDPYRVIRGGSWGVTARLAQSSYRNGNHPRNRVRGCGFRPILKLKKATKK